MSEKTHDALNATLELARKLLARKGASVDELEQATAALPNAIASAERQHGALTEHRRATLVSGSDADLVKVDNEIGAAARLLDRLRAIAEELDARLSQAREQASDAARARNRAKIISERDAVVDRLRKEYPEHALAIAAMLGDLARVDVNIGEFNRTAPAHEKIQSPKTSRVIATSRRAKS